MVEEIADDTPLGYNEDAALVDDTPLDLEDEQGMAEVNEREGFAPPDDGPHVVYLKLKEPTEEKPEMVYWKGVGADRKLVVSLTAKVENKRGRPGTSLKDLYATTVKMQGQTASLIGSIVLLATGENLKLKGKTPSQIIEEIRDVFSDAGEDGVRLLAKTTWSKSVRKLDKDGEPAVKKDGTADYRETKGQIAITQQHIKEATKFAKENFDLSDPADLQRAELFVSRIKNNPWLYFDVARGEEMSVKAEVAGVLGPAPEREEGGEDE